MHKSTSWQLPYFSMFYYRVIMAKVFPFQAVRPTRDKVNLIAARPYDSYTPEERASRLRDNPYSFLHIVNPGYKYQKENTTEQERYTLVRNRYLEFKEEGYFIQDKKPSFYVYKIVDHDGKTTRGIIAAVDIEEYENNIIKKHEDTLIEREKLFKEYIHTVGFNPEPVLLTYPDNDTLADLIQDIMKSRAEYEFTTTYRDTHYLWNIDDPKLVTAIKKEFDKMESLYIADGHHRTASAYELYKLKKEANGSHTGKESYNFLMSYLIPESHLKIYGFNRLIKDLNGLSNEEFLIRLDAVFRINNRGLEYYKPTQKNHFSMYLNGRFYSLNLRKNIYAENNALDALDATILYNTVLNPILGIEDVRNDKRLDYAHGKNDMAYVQSMVDSGEYQVGFGLLPVTTEEIKSVADESLTMPPKTTYIEPKLRNGITIYEY